MRFIFCDHAVNFHDHIVLLSFDIERRYFMLITLRHIVMLSLVIRLLCWICNEHFLKNECVIFTSQSFSKPYSSSSLCS